MENRFAIPIIYIYLQIIYFFAGKYNLHESSMGVVAEDEKRGECDKRGAFSESDSGRV
jgi:hypothetical protein